MDIATFMNGADRSSLNAQVEAFNSSLGGTRSAGDNLDKDDFLKILIAQLRHQDPTKPMEDREFIAQMAQFSSLEQMTNMSRQFTELSAVLKASGAMNLIGHDVEIIQGDSFIQGRVDAVTSGAYPQVLVNGTYYDYADISSVIKGD